MGYEPECFSKLREMRKITLQNYLQKHRSGPARCKGCHKVDSLLNRSRTI